MQNLIIFLKIFEKWENGKFEFSLDNDLFVATLRRVKVLTRLRACTRADHCSRGFHNASLISKEGGAEHRPPGSYLAGGARRHVAYAEGISGVGLKSVVKKKQNES